MDSLMVQAQAQTRFAAADRSILDDCSTSCRRGFVWRACDFGPTANGRDWSTDGSGRGAVAHLSFNSREGLYLSVIGIAIGLLAALALTRVLTSMLVELKPTDPVTFVFVSMLPVDRRHCFLSSSSTRLRIISHDGAQE